MASTDVFHMSCTGGQSVFARMKVLFMELSSCSQLFINISPCSFAHLSSPVRASLAIGHLKKQGSHKSKNMLESEQ